MSTRSIPQKVRWIRVTRRNLCPVCGKPDWCLLARDGLSAICARVSSGKPVGSKGAGWLHKLGSGRPLPPSGLRPAVIQTLKAPPNALDIAYRALLAELTLSEPHRENLQHRGLTNSEIDTLNYKTLPVSGRRELVNSLQIVKLSGVPGFFLEAGCWKLAGPSGIVIPVRDTRGRIVGLQIRCDRADGRKYKWLSSRGYNSGCSPGAPIHIAGPISIGGEIWVIEGPIKADIAALRLNRTFLALPGVSNWHGAIQILRELKPKRVIIAFDMDKNQNTAVRLHLNTLTACLIKRGIRTFEADWDARFKGLDDVLIGD